MSNRVNWYIGQAVTEAELDSAFAMLEEADRDIVSDMALDGIVAGLDVTAVTPVADLSVNVAVGAAYDGQGRRCATDVVRNLAVGNEGTTEIGSTAILAPGASTSVSGGGNEKYVSVFILFDRLDTDLRTDALFNDVYFRNSESFRFLITQGVESPAGTAVPPPLQPNAVLLADIKRSFGVSAISNADIVSTRREVQVNLVSAPQSIQKRTLIEAVQSLLGFYNSHVTGTADRHTASELDVAASGNWADGTGNNAGTLQARFDKLISDLSSITSADGAGKIGAVQVSGTPNSLLTGTIKTQMSDLLVALNAHIGASPSHTATQIVYDGNPGWFDNVAHPTTTVEGELDKIVSDLRGTSGAAYLGAASHSGSPYSIGSSSLQIWLNGLLDDLNAHVTSGGHAASAISYAGSGNWADGSQVSAVTVEAAIDEVVSDLGASSGAIKIGHTQLPAFADAAFIAAGSIGTQLDSLISILAATSGSDGVTRIGAGARTSGSYSLTPGTLGSQLAQLLGFIDAQLDGIAINGAGTYNNVSFSGGGVGVSGNNVSVSGITSGDASLTESGGAGSNFDVRVNPAHSNVWTATQEFTPATDTTPARKVGAPSATGSFKLIDELGAGTISGSPEKVRLWSYRDDAVGGSTAFMVTVNANRSGSTWVKDISGRESMGFWLGTDNGNGLGLFEGLLVQKRLSTNNAGWVTWDQTSQFLSTGVLAGGPGYGSASYAGPKPGNSSSVGGGFTWTDYLNYTPGSASVDTVLANIPGCPASTGGYTVSNLSQRGGVVTCATTGLASGDLAFFTVTVVSA